MIDASPVAIERRCPTRSKTCSGVPIDWTVTRRKGPWQKARNALTSSGTASSPAAESARIKTCSATAGATADSSASRSAWANGAEAGRDEIISTGSSLRGIGEAG
jgi:hypothetical protein